MTDVINLKDFRRRRVLEKDMAAVKKLVQLGLYSDMLAGFALVAMALKRAAEWELEDAS